jgi:ABC-type sugar transport system ATPase subunit
MVDDAALEAEARKLLARYGFESLDPNTPVGTLGIGVQQVVEIVRALSYDAKVLVLDEPTAALTHDETERLMQWLRDLRDAGTTCIYVSHRMDEVFAIADRVTVLRDGKTAGVRVARETTAREVVALMVGRDLEDRPRAQTSRARDSAASRALMIHDLVVGDPGSTPAVNKVSLEVSTGEIVGLCGAMGAGRTAILSTLFGAARAEVRGEVLIGGTTGVPTSPRDAIRRGAALLPEDRKGRGLVLSMTVAENLALPWLDDPSVFGAGAKIGLVDEFEEQRLAAKRVKELAIRGGPFAVTQTLSGGNQQKVVLGKWLERPPKLLLLDEPTRGVDIGAREEIYTILRALAAKGAGILFASSDLEEVTRLAERVIVLRLGRVVGELEGGDITQARIVELATGAAPPAAAAGPLETSP